MSYQSVVQLDAPIKSGSTAALAARNCFSASERPSAELMVGLDSHHQLRRPARGPPVSPRDRQLLSHPATADDASGRVVCVTCRGCLQNGPTLNPRRPVSRTAAHRTMFLEAANGRLLLDIPGAAPHDKSPAPRCDCEERQ